MAQQAGSAELPDAPSVLIAGTAEVQNAAAPAAGQSADAQQKAPLTPEEQRKKAEDQLKAEEQQRMLGLVPNFNEVIGGEAEPLNAKEKFELFFKGAVDPYQFVLAGIVSGLGQLNDSHAGYHYGIQGYTRRYLAAYGDAFIGNFFGNAVLPSILHQDPRYYRLGPGTPEKRNSAGKRILYTAKTTVMCHGDNGHWQFNYSNIAGNFIGGAISNYYYPPEDRGASQVVSSALTVTAEGIFGALAEEFYPDFASYLKHRKERKAAKMAEKDSGQ